MGFWDFCHSHPYLGTFIIVSAMVMGALAFPTITFNWRAGGPKQ